MKIVLETDLPPKEFRKFIESFENDKVKANYDTGNSAALGYNIKEEFREIGKYFGNIHIKDRKFQGNTVPFGYGDVDFELFFNELTKIDYNGELIIQGARQDFKENHRHGRRADEPNRRRFNGHADQSLARVKAQARCHI